ncbi:hypothetical protein [Algoriphagus resistens]|uniref:hypothetical protein n=1 Tax=Algoriphagus resistens TaxID=1750590 RepID=UPI000A464063|nr:hypothetical protein [Algoriphagus resistens]
MHSRGGKELFQTEDWFPVNIEAGPSELESKKEEFLEPNQQKESRLTIGSA